MKNQLYVSALFSPDHIHFDGVRPINIYLMRLVFLLTFLFVGWDSWSTILSRSEPWQPLQAVAFCVWAAYSTLSFLGIFQPLKMIPIILFQIFYKTIWLIIVAYPLWITNQLVGSPAEGMTDAFLWLPLPIVATPWSYVLRNYFGIRRESKKAIVEHSH